MMSWKDNSKKIVKMASIAEPTEVEASHEDDGNEAHGETEEAVPSAKSGSAPRKTSVSPTRLPAETKKTPSPVPAPEKATSIPTPDKVEEADEVSNASVEDSFVPVPLAPPPWEEWSDTFINEETWNNEIYNGKAFEDTFDITEVIQLKSYHWMRPHEFITGTPEVVKKTSTMIDLVNPNAHLCEKSEILRYIISEISELFDYSSQNKTMECEGQGVGYVPNYPEDDKVWTPWSHIYSCCKAGVPGERPAYNPKGLYYVRLYFMGNWRRVLVDDQIPVLHSGHSGLPLTNANELWPLLLTKALLKIATIMWRDSQVKRFSAISALTGWVFEWVENMDGMNEDEFWTDLQNTLPKYIDPKKIPSCYTLLTPSKRKPPRDGSDPFWWMPALIAHPSESDEVTFSEQDTDHMVKVEDAIFTTATTTAAMTDDSKGVNEIRWHRKTFAETHSDQSIGHHHHHHHSAHHHYHHKKSIKVAKSHEAIENLALEKEKVETPPPRQPPPGMDATMSQTGKKKKQKKGPGPAAPAPNEEAPSDKNFKKKEKGGKKQKETNDAEKKETADGKKRKAKKDADDGEGKSDFDTTKHWSKLKNVVMGTVEMDNRESKSVPQSILNKLDEEDEESEEKEEVVVSEPVAKAKTKPSQPLLPTTQEILFGVEKYAGLDYRNLIKKWEKRCGKDLPITLIVVLKQFPPAEMDSGKNTPPPQIPAFLQHPIQLTEVRDSVLHTPSERPTTPLWKRFRWKAWAMKKGIIPVEEDHFVDKIRAIKAKTPFTFKADWPETPGDDDETDFKPTDDEELDGEDREEDDILIMNSFFYGLDDRASVGARQSQFKSIPSPPKEKEKQEEVRTSVFQQQEHRTSQFPEGLKKKSQPDKNEARSSPTDDKSSDRESAPLVLYEAEIVHGESEDDYMEDFEIRMTQKISPVPTTTACGAVWLECGEVARNLKKFCKFYTSQSMFGSCYILRREANILPPILDPCFQGVESNLPQYPDVIMEHKQSIDLFNLFVEFDHRKSYHVTNYHLDNKEGIESAFYLFSDCWTEQEIIIQAWMLQESLLQRFNDVISVTKQEETLAPPPTPTAGAKGVGFSRQSSLRPKPPPIPPLALTLIVEPWDWRKDCCVCEPLINATVTDQWLAHVRLPAGRNTFRIWIMIQGPDGHCLSPNAEVDNMHSKINCSPFNIRFVSQTPIYIGSRNEVHNYMTNPPMLFLKQAERLANNIWGLFACFGKKSADYTQNLRELRSTYCPAYTYPNKINMFVRGAHDIFEELFLNLIMQFNGGVLDRMMLLALRVLFLSPMLGKNYISRKTPRSKEGTSSLAHYLRSLTKKARSMLPSATITIQRYYRGWRVRRLFQMRRKTHPKFRKLEYKVRKIALMLASETDSVFAHSHEFPTDESGLYPKFDETTTIDPVKVPPTLLPKPPYWALDLLSYLTARIPWLLTIFPHAHCVPHHIKIHEFKGALPDRLKDFCWYPFCREVLKVPPEAKSCYCKIDLQVYPKTGIYLRVINNDTGKLLVQASDLMFTGRLAQNKHGYTLLCYKWAFPNLRSQCNERLPSKNWLIRLITPSVQEGPYIVETIREIFSGRDSVTSLSSDAPPQKLSISIPSDTEQKESPPSDLMTTLVPRKLCLRKFTGLYIPNRDFSLCQYVLETDEKRLAVSLRFKASSKTANIHIIIWDCFGKANVFEEKCQGGLIVPVIILQPQKRHKSEVHLHPEDGHGDDEHAGYPLPSKTKSKHAQSSVKFPPMADAEEDKDTENNEESKRKSGGKKYRYIISIHTDEDSWIFQDHELLYLFYKERQFFKDIKREYCKEYIKLQMEKAAAEEERQRALLREQMEAEEEEELEGDLTAPLATGDLLEQIGPPPKTPPNTELTTQPHTPAPEKEKKRDDMKSIKLRKQPKKDKGEVQPQSAEVQAAPDSAPYPAPPPPTTISHTSIHNDENKLDARPKKDVKLKRRSNGNLIMKYGGKQSQPVTHLDQPNWVLEIVTEASVKYKVKSNWQLLRKRLVQMKEPWGDEGNLEILYQDLGQRLDHFLESIIDINLKHNLHQFSMIDPVTNIFSCLCMEKYDFRRMPNNDLVEILEKTWSLDPNENQKAAEKLALLRKSKSRKSEDKELPPYDLDYLPKNLKRLIERTRRNAEDREAERQLRLLMAAALEENAGEGADEDEVEDEEEVEEAISSNILLPSGVTTVSQAQIAPKHLGIAHSALDMKHAKRGKSTKTKKSVHHLDPSHHGKKKPKAGEAKEALGKPKGKDGTASTTDTAKQESVAEEKNETVEEEEDESDLERIRKCDVVQKIFDKFMAFFDKPDPVHDTLIESMTQSRKEDGTSKKYILTRAGISKYCGRGDHEDESLTHDLEFSSKAAAVAEKLLQWTMDFTCLPNTEETDDKIFDIGEFSHFFTKSVIEEKPDYYLYHVVGMPEETSHEDEEAGSEETEEDNAEEANAPEAAPVPEVSAPVEEKPAKVSRDGSTARAKSQKSRLRF